MNHLSSAAADSGTFGLERPSGDPRRAEDRSSIMGSPALIISALKGSLPTLPSKIAQVLTDVQTFHVQQSLYSVTQMSLDIKETLCYQCWQRHSSWHDDLRCAAERGAHKP